MNFQIWLDIFYEDPCYLIMRWNIKQPSDKLVSELKKKLKTSEIIAKVWANRGIESIVSYKDLFDPNIHQLYDSFIKNIQDEIPI